MWMVPRNIRRIEPWKVSIIATLLDVNQGNVQSQTLQDQIYDELSQQGVKCARSSTGVAWNWDVGAEFRISIKKPELQGLRP